jgi:hypothetical protein
MVMDQTTGTILAGAFAQARAEKYASVSAKHVLCVLATQPLTVRDILADLGVTPEHIQETQAERFRRGRERMAKIDYPVDRNRELTATEAIATPGST